jgi:hypothetical protein
MVLKEPIRLPVVVIATQRSPVCSIVPTVFRPSLTENSHRAGLALELGALVRARWRGPDGL